MLSKLMIQKYENAQAENSAPPATIFEGYVMF